MKGSGKKGKSKAIKSKRVNKPKMEKKIKAIVQKELNKDVEDKMAYFNPGDSLISFNSGISSASDMLQIIPNISNGNTDNSRIGDQLTAKRLKISGHIRLYPKTQTGTVSNEPKLSNVVCRLMVLSVKSNPSYPSATLQPGILSSLLKKGGTTTAFTGVLSDIHAPINTDIFTCHYDTNFYLSQDYVFVPSSTGGTYTNSAVAVDVKDSIRFFNINLKVKNKVLKYDSVNGGILPTNYGAFMVLGYSYLDGSSPDSLNTQVGMQYISTLNFEDA